MVARDRKERQGDGPGMVEYGGTCWRDVTESVVLPRQR